MAYIFITKLPTAWRRNLLETPVVSYVVKKVLPVYGT
jgi:hypothetical protein